MALVSDPGCPGKTRLITRILAAEFRERRRKLKLRLGLQQLRDAVPSDWEAPDSELAKSAEKTAASLCSQFILDHCRRTYYFGAILAARDGVKLDKEILYVSSILHDLGLSEAHKDDEGSFEWVGAKLAHDLCISRGAAAQRAEQIHNAVALHASVGIADISKPEVAVLHLGAGADLFGMRIDEVPAQLLSRILEDYPRTEFKSCFGACLKHQGLSKPTSHFSSAIRLGIADRIQDSLD